MTKQTPEQPIPVIFRILEGEVIALFPTLPADYNGHLCDSYMHVGQHGGADPLIVHTTRLATPEEYADLYKELTEQIGYTLRVCTRISQKMTDTRRAEAKRIRSL